MSEWRSVSVAAPAKLNLGLEILGKRPDGYHEIRTVMAMIDLADSMTLTSTDQAGGVRIDGVPGVTAEDNLIARAIQAFPEPSGRSPGYEVSVKKRIPSPGGLGGASSDAAATLLAMNALRGGPLSPDELANIASSLGADVPFFLGAPAALASGTGTTLHVLPPVQGWVVLVVPSMNIGAKTPTLYRALQAGDFTDGSWAGVAAEALAKGELPAPRALRNAFERPLYELVPELFDVRARMQQEAAPFVALSGAGPAHYTLYDSEAEARSLGSRLRSVLADDTFLTVTRFLLTRPGVEAEEG